MEEMGRKFLCGVSQLEPIFHTHSFVVIISNANMDDRGRKAPKRLSEITMKEEMGEGRRKVLQLLVITISKFEMSDFRWKVVY